jgi:hypothetical protein
MQGRKVREQLDVSLDGLPDRWHSEHWGQLVEDFFPLEVSQLFFFDAEKIRSLAEDETSSQVLGTAVKSLLGLDIAERLIADSAVLEARLAKALEADKPREERAGLARKVDQLRPRSMAEEQAASTRMSCASQSRRAAEEEFRQQAAGIGRREAEGGSWMTSRRIGCDPAARSATELPLCRWTGWNGSSGRTIGANGRSRVVSASLPSETINSTACSRAGGCQGGRKGQLSSRRVGNRLGSPGDHAPAVARANPILPPASPLPGLADCRQARACSKTLAPGGWAGVRRDVHHAEEGIGRYSSGSGGDEHASSEEASNWIADRRPPGGVETCRGSRGIRARGEGQGRRTIAAA